MKDYKTQVPESYYEPIANGGRIEEFTYSSIRSDNGNPCTKRALVYLPSTYDATDIKLPVLYLMHGGGGDEEEFLYGQDRQRHLINILDHMINSGELEPLVIIAPSFYYEKCQAIGHDISEAGVLTSNWHTEFRNDLIPAAEKLYRIRDDREGRVFGGFSMGSCTTWWIFIKCLDLVKNFMPLSGDCWIAGEKGGLSKTSETVQLMKEALASSKFDSLGYNIFAATGNLDIAYPALSAQLDEMYAKGWNNPSEDKNLRHFYWEEGTHCYQYIYKYMYNMLPDIFKV